MKVFYAAIAAVLAATSFASSYADPWPLRSQTATSALTLQLNKKSALALLAGLMNRKDPSVVDKYVTADLKQHNPRVGDGREALRAVIPLFGNSSKVEFGAAVADGDLVWVHTRFSGAPNLPTSVGLVVYLFLNGKVVEQWEIIQMEVPAAQSANGNPMFPIQGSPSAAKSPQSVAEANRLIILDYIEDLFNNRDMSYADRYLGVTYTQHNANIPNGVGAIRNFVVSLTNTTRVEIGATAAADDWVWVSTRYDFGTQQTPWVSVDVFRLENGRLVEHWDVLQDEVTVENTVSGRPMFPIGP